MIRSKCVVGLSPRHTSPKSLEIVSKLGSQPGRAHDFTLDSSGDDGPVLTVATGGAYVKAQPGAHPRRASASGRRGRIVDYSRSSRKRLLTLLNSINRPACRDLPLFITLTYPAVWSADPARWKRDLDVLGKRLVAEFPRVAFIWKLEYQKRGAPHYHLLLFGVRYVDHKWLAQQWYEVVDSGDEKHLQAGTEVRPIEGWRGVLSYAAKYLTKAGLPVGMTWAGRYWGVVGRRYLPVLMQTYLLSWQEFYRLRRLIWRVLAAQGHKTRRRSLYRSASGFLLEQTVHRLLHGAIVLAAQDRAATLPRSIDLAGITCYDKPNGAEGSTKQHGK